MVLLTATMAAAGQGMFLTPPGRGGDVSVFQGYEAQTFLRDWGDAP